MKEEIAEFIEKSEDIAQRTIGGEIAFIKVTKIYLESLE